MSKLVKSVTSPKKFITGKRLLENLNDYIEDYGDHAYIICDEFILERAQKEAGNSIQKAGNQAVFEKFNYECTQEEIDRNRELARNAGANIIVGIGGEKRLIQQRPPLITRSFRL